MPVYQRVRMITPRTKRQESARTALLIRSGDNLSNIVFLPGLDRLSAPSINPDFGYFVKFPIFERQSPAERSSAGLCVNLKLNTYVNCCCKPYLKIHSLLFRSAISDCTPFISTGTRIRRSECSERIQHYCLF